MYKRQVEATLQSEVDLTGLRVLSADLPPGVVTDALRAADGSLVIKLHNRNFDDTTVLPVSGTLTVPLAAVPDGAEASWFKAGHYAEPLSLEVSTDAVTVTVPTFSDFALVRIGSPIRYRHFSPSPVAWRSDQE